MTMQSFPVHILPSGEVTPIPNWTGGETEARIVVVPTKTEKEQNVAFEDFMTTKEIRAERLERKDDADDWPTPTDEQLEKMYSICRGVLEGMTQEEFEQLREERIMGVK
jgi:hypothetical protein